MAEHWCKEHQIVWFKKGKMKGYAHPILDEDGEPTGEWCNEPKSDASVESKTPEPSRGGSTNDSIESQVAFKGMIELIVADKIQINSTTGIATIAWAITRLGGKDVKTLKDIPNEETAPRPTRVDDSGGDGKDRTPVKTPQELMAWALSHDKKYTPSWVRLEAHIGVNTIITNEMAVEIHKSIKAVMGWED